MQKINPGNHGGTVDCGGFTVSFVNALHSSSWTKPNGEGIYLGNPLGLIVKAPGEPTLYHMGDTGIFGDMALIHEIYQPEVGIVPIGDRFTMGGEARCDGLQALLQVPPHRAAATTARSRCSTRSPEKFIAEMGADGQQGDCAGEGEGVRRSDGRLRLIERQAVALYSQPSFSSFGTSDVCRPDTVKRVAHLARISVSDEEAEACAAS